MLRGAAGGRELPRSAFPAVCGGRAFPGGPGRLQVAQGSEATARSLGAPDGCAFSGGPPDSCTFSKGLRAATSCRAFPRGPRLLRVLRGPGTAARSPKRCSPAGSWLPAGAQDPVAFVNVRCQKVLCNHF